MYRELAENIDTTRHGLALGGAVAPDREKLEKALASAKAALGNISALTRSHVS